MAGGVAEDAAEHREGVRRQLKEAMVARDAQDVESLRTALEAACEVDPTMEDVKPARGLLQRMEAETRPLTFTDVSAFDTETLQAATTREEVANILMKCMKLSLDSGFQAEILAEFHYHNFMFCQRQKFRAETTSTFLSIMNVLHTRAIVKEKLAKPRAHVLFEELLRRHCRTLPPYSFGAFTEAEALMAREFAGTGFFRHYDMYAFAYTGREDLRLSTIEERVALKVPKVVALHKAFEVDPREVPELKELFLTSEDEALMSDFAGGLHLPSGGLSRGGGSLSSLHSATAPRGGATSGLARGVPGKDDGQKAAIEAAIDEALTAKLGGHMARLAKHPLA